MCGICYDLDVALFRWVNDGWSSRFLDAFFSFITNEKNPWNWFLVAIGVLWLVAKGGAKGRFVVLAIIISVAVTDPFTTRVIKPFVKRVRPCNILPNVNTPFIKSGSYSFPSVHAANQGASMTVLSLAYPPGAPYFVGIALLVGLSRVYLGLHYPSDIVGGFLLGILIGIYSWRAADQARQKWFLPRAPISDPSRKRGK